MDNFNTLKNLWKESITRVPNDPVDLDVLIKSAQKKIRSSIQLQWGTVIILLITFFLISMYFKYVAQFHQTLSHIGEWLMLGGLAIRILLELFSIYLSKNIRLTGTVLQSNRSTFVFFKFRNWINGPVTITILILYTIGFYMLLPEFSLYFKSIIVVLFGLSYIFAAFIFMGFIRSAVKKEKKILKELEEIQQDLARE
ncbi:MAG: hypothetical protein ABIN48_06445 [Ginsengibacter sp.]